MDATCRTKTANRPTLWLLAVLATSVALSSFAASAAAQESASGDEEEQTDEKTARHRIVVLDVPTGGTEQLVRRVEEIGSFDVRRQSWFVRKVKYTDVENEDILSRPEALAEVMDVHEIDGVLLLKPVFPEKGTDAERYRVVFVGTGGELDPIGEVRVGDGVNEAVAEEIRRLFEASYFDVGQVNSELQDCRETVSSCREKRREQADKIAEETTTDDERGQKGEGKSADTEPIWVRARAGFRLFKRMFEVTGGGNALLRMTSGYFPGFEVSGWVYPFTPSAPQYSAFGLYASYAHGFGTFPTRSGSDAGPTVSGWRIDGAFGALVRLGRPGVRAPGRGQPTVRLKLFGEYSRDSLDPRAILPTMGRYSFVLEGGVTHNVFHDRFLLDLSVGMTPVAFFQTGQRAFGRSALVRGFRGRLGGRYAVTDSVQISLGYRFSLDRLQFEGAGRGGFVDSEGVDLVHGLDVNVEFVD